MTFSDMQTWGDLKYYVPYLPEHTHEINKLKTKVLISG